ncbi:unnamed protein product [Albugo candida]|uniref:Uncharacterized protein n=1 Tax=Albugo candida TaxID=65357 RepID=A0A024G4E3_9STRA|nr:unnamed protein product [Albugo candida]|eukprot:CCI41537.1 unnamed protein product [Albugo candida]
MAIFLVYTPRILKNEASNRLFGVQVEASSFLYYRVITAIKNSATPRIKPSDTDLEMKSSQRYCVFTLTVCIQVRVRNEKVTHVKVLSLPLPLQICGGHIY